MTVAAKLVTVAGAGLLAGAAAGAEGFVITAWALARGGPAPDGLDALTALLVAGVFALQAAVAAGAAAGLRLTGRPLAAAVAVGALAVALAAEHVTLLRAA